MGRSEPRARLRAVDAERLVSTSLVGVEFVEEGDVRRSPFRVAITPLPSLACALRDAAGAGRFGTPQPWCDAIRRHLRAQDYQTLAPFVRPGPMLIPDALLGLAEAPGESLKDGLERMMATPPELLAAEIASCDVADGAWDAAARHPAAWLRRYVTSLMRAWQGFEPVWLGARPALDRETARIGIATARDAQLELLDGLLARGAVHDRRWCVRCTLYGGRVRFPDSGLVLMPLVAGARGSILVREGDIFASVSYPVRSALTREPAAPPAAALEGLLGVPRAQILRAIGRPTSIGELAERLRAVPSAATHHVSALEAADLVERDRRGRNVLVRRTARGQALLEIYHPGEALA